MRKSTLFVSALLTVFLMVTMFGVVSAYQQATGSASRFNARQPQSVAFQAIDPVSLATVAEAPAVAAVAVPSVVTPEQATTIAVDFLGDPNVFSVEVVDYQGAQTYLVTFSSGDLIYVSPTGQILSVDKIQPVIVAAAPNTANSNQPNNGGGSHSDDDDHDDHDDDHGDDD